jgi:hypothetical protein
VLTDPGVTPLPLSPPFCPSLLDVRVEERDLLVSTGVLRTGGPTKENSETAFSASWQQSGIRVRRVSCGGGLILLSTCIEVWGQARGINPSQRSELRADYQIAQQLIADKINHLKHRLCSLHIAMHIHDTLLTQPATSQESRDQNQEILLVCYFSACHSQFSSVRL